MDNPEDDPLYEPARPYLPDVSAKLEEVKRQVAKARTIDLKSGYIDLALDELDDIKKKGWKAFHVLTGKNRLDNPDPFLEYASVLDNTISELHQLRQRVLLAEAERTAKQAKPESTAPEVPTFATTEINQPAPPKQAPPTPEVMDVEQLSAYWGRSTSYIYKHYEEEGIPYSNVGGLSFLKSSFDAWLAAREIKKSKDPT